MVGYPKPPVSTRPWESRFSQPPEHLREVWASQSFDAIRDSIAQISSPEEIHGPTNRPISRPEFRLHAGELVVVALGPLRGATHLVDGIQIGERGCRQLLDQLSSRRSARLLLALNLLKADVARPNDEAARGRWSGRTGVKRAP